MIPATPEWFVRQQFVVWQIPGVSRAWRFEFDNGCYVLVTDIGGYDLPEPGGPYAAMSFTSADEMIEYEQWLRSPRALLDWFRHTARLCAAVR